MVMLILLLQFPNEFENVISHPLLQLYRRVYVFSCVAAFVYVLQGKHTFVTVYVSMIEVRSRCPFSVLLPMMLGYQFMSFRRPARTHTTPGIFGLHSTILLEMMFPHELQRLIWTWHMMGSRSCSRCSSNWRSAGRARLS